MMRRLTWWIVLLLAGAPLALAACDRDDDDDTPDSAEGHGFEQTVATEFGLTVHYPEGWQARVGDGRVSLANNDLILNAISTGRPSEYPQDGFGMIIFAPLTPERYPGLTGQDAAELLAALAGPLADEAEGGAFEVGEQDETTVGEQPAARVALTRADSLAEGYLVGFKPEPDVALLAMVLAREGVLEDNSATARSILAAVEYEILPPAEETPEGPPPSTPEDEAPAAGGQ